MKATGERWERCLWQMKRPERVAAVDRCQGAPFDAGRCRAPQQELSEEWRNMV